jgi:hypothetical protein
MPDIFSPANIERICQLNRHLTAIEDWLTESADSAIRAYLSTGGGECRKKNGVCLDEDFESQSFLKYSLGQDDPGYNLEEEFSNRLAWSMPFSHALDDDEFMRDMNWNEGVPQKGVLATTHFCYLFHDLLEHQLHYDWDNLLRIGEICVELTFIRQTQVSWPPLREAKKRSGIDGRSVFDLRVKHDRPEVLSQPKRLYLERLSQRVFEAQAWIRTQARLSQESCIANAHQKAGLAGSRVYENKALSATTSFELRPNHPEFDPDDDNIITCIHQNLAMDGRNLGQVLSCRSMGSMYQDEEFWRLNVRNIDDITSGHKGEIKLCSLFHSLMRDLDSDWNLILAIGSLWLEVSLRRQLIVRWP